MVFKVPLWPTLWTLAGLAFVFVPGRKPPFLVAAWATVALVLWATIIYADRMLAWRDKKLRELQQEDKHSRGL